MRVLITGVAGRLGMAVYHRLMSDGHEVYGVDRMHRADLPPEQFEVVDLHSLPAVYRLMRGVDVLVHLANSPQAGSPDHERVYLNNIQVNGNVLLAAAQSRVRRVIYASSIQAATGDRTDPQQRSSLAYLPMDGQLPIVYGNLYGLSKAMGEQMLAFHCQAGDLEGISIRFPSILEPRWVRRRLERGRNDLGGTRRLDEAGAYVLIADASELVARCVSTPNLAGHRVYLPSGPESSWQVPLAEVLAKLYPDVPLRRPLDQLGTLIDQQHIAADLGWAPQSGLSGHD
jgi:nucleoside-diphosphate-sugar epimerase